MEVNFVILLIILGSAVVTFIPRVLPLVVLSRLTLPDWLMRWLGYVPIAVMAALVGQTLLLSDDHLSWQIPELLAALVTFLIAIVSRSLLATVVAGMIAMMVLRFLWI